MEHIGLLMIISGAAIGLPVAICGLWFFWHTRPWGPNPFDPTGSISHLKMLNAELDYLKNVSFEKDK